VPVVFVVLDAFPNHEIGPELTPTLWRLCTEGGRSEAGGVAQLPAVTATNHATFVTGRGAIDHGLVANLVPLDGEWVPAGEVGPEVATLFDACRAEGLVSVAAVGDPDLLGICGAEAATRRWPSDEQPPAGCVTDAAVVEACRQLDLASADLVLVQLDEVDQACHRYGPSSAQARAQYQATDAALGQILGLVEPLWDQTVVFVVSDHDCEDVAQVDKIDLGRALRGKAMVAAQGTSALVVGPVGPADLLGLRGVADYRSLDADHHLVWGHRGQTFGTGPLTVKGDHGSPRTATQVAVVGGGGPEVPELAARLVGRRPPATAWATWVAEALGLGWRPEPDDDQSTLEALG
jgi:hypothetical protein